MRKREHWLFGFSAISAIAGIFKIAEYFGIKVPQDKGVTAPLVTHLSADLIWAICLSVVSLSSSAYGFYSRRSLRDKGLVRTDQVASQDGVHFAGSLNVSVNRKNGVSEFLFTTSGVGLSKIELSVRPTKIRIESPSSRHIEEGELSVDLRVHGGHISINAFSEGGIVLNDRGLRGYVLLSA